MDLKAFKLDIDELINGFAEVRFADLTRSLFFLLELLSLLVILSV